MRCGERARDVVFGQSVNRGSVLWTTPGSADKR